MTSKQKHSNSDWASLCTFLLDGMKETPAFRYLSSRLWFARSWVEQGIRINPDAMLLSNIDETEWRFFDTVMHCLDYKELPNHFPNSLRPIAESL